MGKYFRKKVLVYLITFVLAITINWMIPRAMPGNPIQIMLSRITVTPDTKAKMQTYYKELFGLDKPWIIQYLNYWKSIFTGNLGRSISFGLRPVGDILSNAVIFDFLLMFPALLLSFIFGNKLGAVSGVNKRVDNILMPVFYFLTSAPYFWFAVILSFIFGMQLNIFPLGGAYGQFVLPGFSLHFILDFLYHWFLPFMSLFAIMLGQWAIGMRNMIIYEMGTNYSRFMEAMGSRRGLIRRYAYRNGILPQVTGLGIRLGQFIGGALATEIVFQYPGLGYILFRAIIDQDYFLLQGIFLFIILLMLVANFTVDIIYMFLDPRVRVSFSGGSQ